MMATHESIKKTEPVERSSPSTFSLDEFIQKIDFSKTIDIYFGGSCNPIQNQVVMEFLLYNEIYNGVIRIF
jgi:hypothetical protein